MPQIRINNWFKYQHYKNRRPPWIKLYNKLLRKPEFICLQDDSKLLLMLLWLFASTIEDKEPLILGDEKYLKKVLPFNGKVNLQPLIKAGFIEMIADCYQNDSNLRQKTLPETDNTETETDNTETETEVDIFEKARKEFGGTVRGLNTEFGYFKKTHRDWRDCLTLLLPAIQSEKVHKENLRKSKAFCPAWKNFKTWIFNRCWEQEFTAEGIANPKPIPRCKCGRQLNDTEKQTGICFQCEYHSKLKGEAV